MLKEMAGKVLERFGIKRHEVRINGETITITFNANDVNVMEFLKCMDEIKSLEEASGKHITGEHHPGATGIVRLQSHQPSNH